MSVPTQKKALVFIAGLGHSGSTLFDLLLGAQQGITGLGEVDVFLNPQKNEWYLKRFDKYPCTCGMRPSECVVWGEFKNHLEQNDSQSYAELYAKLFDTAVAKTGASVIVDSSKNLHSLSAVYNSLDQIGLEKEQFYVIHLVKDVRSFAASMKKSGLKKGTLNAFRSWKKSNLKIDKFLKKNNIKTIWVGYDELALSTRFLIERVLNFIFHESTPKVCLDLTQTRSHIVSGNNMRLDNADKIRYDYRWFDDPQINLIYSLYPTIQKFNRKWVYNNVPRL